MLFLYTACGITISYQNKHASVDKSVIKTIIIITMLPKMYKLASKITACFFYVVEHYGILSASVLLIAFFWFIDRKLPELFERIIDYYDERRERIKLEANESKEKNE